jgi:hypothetical protein
MESEITNGTILIEEGTLLPKDLKLEGEPYVRGWRIVKHFEGFGLSREIQKTGRTFFCVASEIRATVFGIDMQKMVRRAIERILTRARSEKVNSLEITQMTSVGSERFPLVSYVTVSARPRNVEENFFLRRSEDLPAKETNALKNLSDGEEIASKPDIASAAGALCKTAA